MLVLSALVAMACSGDPDPAVPTTTSAPEPNAEAYGAALGVILEDTEPPDTDRTVVYVVPLDEGVDIDTQASVIDRFAEAYDVRFVDDLGAAVVGDDDRRPPRDDGIVVGLGTITLQPPHRVRLEQYVAVDDVRATRVTLELAASGWTVSRTEPVAAEVLVDAP